MAGTTIVLARVALIAALQARPRLQGLDVVISYDYPSERQASDAIWTAFSDDPTSSRITALRTSPHKRDESYRIVCAIEVRGDGNAPQQEIDARCAGLMAEVENALAEDPYLGLHGTILSAMLDSYRPYAGAWSGGRICRFEMSLLVTARLT